MTPDLILNRFRGGDAAFELPDDIPFPSDDPAPVLALLAQCPAAGATPLTDLPGVAEAAGVAQVWAKDERGRMGLGSFKALGAAHVIARAAADTGAEDLSQALAGRTYVTASAGNHGLSVAAGARVFGARAVVYLSDTVPDAFAQRLAAQGAEVVRAGRDYEASMDAAAHAAAEKGWTLLSDSSWPGYTESPWILMQGYLAIMAEVADQIDAAPTHVVVQGGVGGLAAAVAAATRKTWGDAPKVVVVEPAWAPCIAASLEAGRFTPVTGPVSSMGRLDCKEASLIALRGLARDADAAVSLSDAEVEAALPALAAQGMATTPSGGAGLALLMNLDRRREALGIDANSRILTFVTEAPE
ncbi:pyridoxal-phosphate dependent enzyme [Aestuariicoccus sp. MJ-SS9]|uniref:pyridoxal-phosphate dependent enzyme n=1 Tax=Aestuariicoccus sp. MJ-SS9 TaxID=3079855 RepID=UPI002913F2B4|nr:pyridoxal-phosphate dependent enzyme [Aestuariicoccus sp. MJ-SS9]MDU8910403.1 pyridoxal-phosphate dependent enzyme [Aestuariicoccus sp. MJ-SS9]